MAPSFFDNFFSSVKLVPDLLKEYTLACGTIQAKRVNLPTDISEGKYYRGQVKFWSCGNLSVVRWKDKRDVYAISSWYSSKMVTFPPPEEMKQMIMKCISLK